MGSAIVWLIDTVIELLIFLIFVRAIVSWLVQFDIINTRNRVVWQILTMMERLTDPILRPISRVVPSIGGIDISPIIAWLALTFLLKVFDHTVAIFLIRALG